MNKKVAALKLRDHKLAVSSKDTVLVVTEAFEKYRMIYSTGTDSIFLKSRIILC